MVDERGNVSRWNRGAGSQHSCEQCIVTGTLIGSYGTGLIAPVVCRTGVEETGCGANASWTLSRRIVLVFEDEYACCPKKIDGTWWGTASIDAIVAR